MNLWLRFIWQMLFSSRKRVAKVFDEVKTPFRVLLIDIDPNMHMNNGVYLSIIDLARFDMSFKNGLMAMMLTKVEVGPVPELPKWVLEWVHAEEACWQENVPKN